MAKTKGKFTQAEKVNDAAGKKAEFNSLLKAGVDGQKQIVKEHIGYFGTEKWNKK